MAADHPSPAWNLIAAETIDALACRVAVIAQDGLIVAANRAWRRFAREQYGHTDILDEGSNYLAACEATNGPDAEAAARCAEGLRAVLAGRVPSFVDDQPCHVGAALRWFRLRIDALAHEDATRAVVVFDDMTSQKQSELALRQTEAALQRAQEIAQFGNWSADFTTGLFTSSPEAARIIGWEPGTHRFEKLRESIYPADLPLQEATWAQAMETGRYQIEHRVLVHGAVRWVRVKAEIRHDHAGRPLQAFGITQDITEQRHALDALRESRALYAGLLDTSPDAILVVRDGCVAFVNPACVRLFKADSEIPLIGRPAIGLFHADDQEVVRTWLQRLELAEAVRGLEQRIVTAEAGVVTVEVVAAPFHDREGRAFHVVLRDVTERVRMHEALAEERAGLRTLLDTIPDSIWVKNVQGEFILCNPAFERLAGAPEERILCRTDHDFFPVALADAFRQQDERAIVAGGPIYIEEQLDRAGQPVWLETIKTPMFHGGHLVGVLGIGRDVTEKRRIHAALETSERQRQFALDAAQLGTWFRLPGSTRLRIDERTKALLDLDRDEIDTQDLIARIHPDDRARVLEEVGASALERQALEVRVRHRDGTERWLLAHVHAGLLTARDGSTSVLRSGTVQDVTDRKHTEAMIARFVSANPVVIYALAILPDGSTSFRWLSDNLKAITGWSPLQATAPGWWMTHVHPEDRERVAAASRAEAIGEHLILEFRFRRADGGYLWIRDEKRVVRDNEGQPSEIVGSWSDITRRVALEDQLRQSQKLEAVGLLAGGIAHDFNNLLTVIAGSSDLLAPLLTTGGQEQHLLSEIKEAGERASSLTRQLLAFSRTQMLAPRVLLLNDVIGRLRAMLSRLIAEDIALEFRLSPSAGLVLVDPGQLEQVVVNLVVNARDAMPRGGRLTIETSEAHIDAEYSRAHHDLAPGVYARLDVGDTGSGMTPEVTERAFEPFFTTKPPGKGTGLGLSTVFGIVKQSGGHIEVQSAVGVGSRFSIFLPRAAGVPRPDAVSTVAAGHAARPGHETILLVEDEESVRKLARLALERNGYVVLTAPNGRAALEVAENYEQPIDLLVTDVVMPEMRGPELADTLSGQRPGLKVLFMSGYVQDLGERTDLSDATFLHKPFSLKQLADKVRALLDGSA